MPQGSFSSTVSSWVRKTQTRMLAVRNLSIERILEIAQTPVAVGGNMPVKTGFLRSSLVCSIGGIDYTGRGNPGGSNYSWSVDQVSAVLAASRLEDTIYAVYTANYAIFQEYGTSFFEGRRFVGLAAQRWQEVVANACAEAEARFG